MRAEALRAAVVRRTARALETPSAAAGVHASLEVELSAPLLRHDAERLEAEAWHAASAPLPGTLPIGKVEVHDRRITVAVGPIPPGAIRLDALWAMLARRASPFGGMVSAYIVERLSSTLGALHRAADPGGAPRVHGRLSKHAVLVTPEGGLILIGTGLGSIDALIVPAPDAAPDRMRYLAPEAARSERTDGRADVYSLAVLYYELLSGRAYRDGVSGNDLFARALERSAPDLPGALPDPQPALLEVLRAALDGHSDRRFSVIESFGAAVRAPGAQDGARALLSRLIEEFATREPLPRGAAALLAGETSIARSGAIGAPILAHAIGRDVTYAPEPKLAGALAEPEPEAAPAPKPEISSAWKEVLGEDLTDDASAEPLDHAKLGAVATPPRPPPSPPRAMARITLPPPSADSKAAPQLTALATAPDPVLSALQFNLEPSAASMRARRIGPGQVFLLRGAAVVVVLLFCGALFFAMKTDPATREDEGTGLGARMRRAAQKARNERPARPPPVMPERPPLEAATPPPTPQLPRGGSYPLVSGEEQPQATKLGLLSVISNPSGASVLVDGGFIGKTPVIMRHEFDKDLYRVEIVLDGHKSWEGEVPVDPTKGTLSVVVTLEPER